MNNKTYFYRIANYQYKFFGIYPIGPYAFFNDTVWQNAKILPYTADQYDQFARFCANETSEYKKLKIDNYKLKRVPTLPNAWRPGPFEDIDLREKMIDKMGAMSKNGKFHLYGFDSMIQALNWYNNHAELNFLKNCGFAMYKFRIWKKNMIVGKRQSVYFPNIDDNNEMAVTSVIDLTALHKPITLPVIESVSELFV